MDQLTELGIVTNATRAVFGHDVKLDANGSPIEKGIGAAVAIIEVVAPESIPVIAAAEDVAEVVQEVK